MKCKECDGKGETYELAFNGMDADYSICYKCDGTGEHYDQSDPQPWDVDHPGWKRFEAHRTSKWKTRFVLSGCDRNFDKIVEVLKKTTNLVYVYVFFDEATLYPGVEVSYIYPCVYFFPANERSPSEVVSKNELDELYWY